MVVLIWLNKFAFNLVVVFLPSPQDHRHHIEMPSPPAFIKTSIIIVLVLYNMPHY
ncbi:hypothetical protein Hanom_Chr02g00144741 [Helianthus anomalus]